MHINVLFKTGKDKFSQQEDHLLIIIALVASTQ